MMEQQMTLKSNDLQERWNTCVLTTCYAYRQVEQIKELFDNVLEVITQIINSLAEIFKPLVDTCKGLFDIYTKDDFITVGFIYSRSFPSCVSSFKINTKGFPRPVTHCARSRC